MIYLRRKILNVFMVLMVFFGAITPVYASQVVPSIASALMTSADQATQKSSGEFLAVKQAMPCHQLNETSREALCFKHCLSSLNQPCLLSDSIQLDVLPVTQTRVSFNIAAILTPEHSTLDILSGSDPPFHHSSVKISNSLSVIVLTSSRFRF